jgi:hypothetical protein
VFVVDSTGLVRKASHARFRRLWERHPKARFPEDAGRRILCAVASVNWENRKPVSLAHVECLIIPLGNDGRMDTEAFARGLGLAVANAGALKPVTEHVIAARHLFTRRRYQHEFRSTPTNEQIRAIIDATLQA